MIEKLAVLAIDKADGAIELVAGDKGAIYQKTRQMIRDLNAAPGHDVLRLRAFFQGGILKQYKFKANIQAATAPAPEEIEDEGDTDELAKRVRADLKLKGVKVPPRISVEKLLDLAVEHGVEV